MCFAQQVQGYGCEGDVLLAISTSGNSQNVLYAATVAKAKGLKVIGLTGANESKLSAIADVCVRVPQTETYMIQELHLPVYHWFCLKLEETFWK
jgi:D-sedoheptulose 7-phosphate isomerase